MALLATGCGGSTAASPSPSPSESSIGSYLSKRAYDPSYPNIKTQIKQQVTDALAAAWTSAFSASGQGTPAP